MSEAELCPGCGDPFHEGKRGCRRCGLLRPSAFASVDDGKVPEMPLVQVDARMPGEQLRAFAAMFNEDLGEAS